MRTDPAAARLSVDSRALDALRTEAARNPAGAARQAAVQFESLFMQMVMKSMRDATPKADGSPGGGDTFAGMLDTQFAKQFAGRPNGLADMIEKQLTRHMQNLPAPSENAAAPAPATAPAAPTAPAAQPSAQVVSPAAAAAAPIAASRAASFIETMLPHARQAQRQTGVPASFILGQAALESGWGRREIPNADGTPSFNLFGIKATPGWAGATTEVATTEFEQGRMQRSRASFRSYGSYAEAFADYARLIASQPRYAQAVRGANSPEAFAGGMQRGGYATDPDYALKLTRTINQAMALQRAMG